MWEDLGQVVQDLTNLQGVRRHQQGLCERGEPEGALHVRT